MVPPFVCKAHHRPCRPGAICYNAATPFAPKLCRTLLTTIMTSTDHATAGTHNGITESWMTGREGHQFYTRTWRATDPKAVLIYVHGFADHVSRYDDVFDKWQARGITVFGYDLRGFGKTAFDEEHRSPGSSYGKTSRKDELADLEYWVQHVSTEFPGLPLFMMGYSAVSVSEHISIPSLTCSSL